MKDCYMKGGSSEACQNYIRILVKKSDTDYLFCGTNAFWPMCHQYKLSPVRGFFLFSHTKLSFIVIYLVLIVLTNQNSRQNVTFYFSFPSSIFSLELSLENCNILFLVFKGKIAPQNLITTLCTELRLCLIWSSNTILFCKF